MVSITGEIVFVAIYFIVSLTAYPIAMTPFEDGQLAKFSRSVSMMEVEDLCISTGSSILLNNSQCKRQARKRLDEPQPKPDVGSVQSPSSLSEPVTIFYRVPNSGIGLKITTRPRVLSGTNMHITLTNARNYVLTAIHRQRGNDPIPRGLFMYPPNITGIGVIFVAFRQRLTWNEVDSALIGLVAVLWSQGLYTEASFMIYKWHDERDLEEEGSGTIYSVAPPGNTTSPDSIDQQ